MASTLPNGWVLDPFAGSSTTGIAANLSGRRFVGIDKEPAFLELSKLRRMDLDDPGIFHAYRKKIKDLAIAQD
ncbi:MAG: site-specific DNA-methyltransferase [Prevotella sp.]|nr:site-specific DNA-methyltransferase [Prevotella sp.]